jgi:amino acid transporter
MAEAAPGKLGTFSTLSIGIGGMVGGGIFAVTGLTIEVTKGAAPVAFLIAGLVALLTSYSYLKLTLAFPGEGGTVDRCAGWRPAACSSILLRAAVGRRTGVTW